MFEALEKYESFEKIILFIKKFTLCLHNLGTKKTLFLSCMICTFKKLSYMN